MRPLVTRLALPFVALAIVTLGCQTEDEPITPDPEGLEDPGEAPEGSPDDELGESPAEPGSGEPAVEGDSEGRLDPESLEDEDDEDG